MNSHTSNLESCNLVIMSQGLHENDKIRKGGGRMATIMKNEIQSNFIWCCMNISGSSSGLSHLILAYIYIYIYTHTLFQKIWYHSYVDIWITIIMVYWQHWFSLSTFLLDITFAKSFRWHTVSMQSRQVLVFAGWPMLLCLCIRHCNENIADDFSPKCPTCLVLWGAAFRI